MLRHYRSEVGLTTTRRGEMISPNVTRQRGQTLQQRHSLPLPWSRHDPLTAETCWPASLSKQRSGTPYNERPSRDATTQRPSSTLPLPGRAQLGIIVDRQSSTTGHHSMSYRHRTHQRERDKLHQQQQQQQQQQQRQVLMAVDRPPRDDRKFSRASTIQSGNGTTNSTSISSQGYFTDCESEQSTRQPQRRRRLPQSPTTTAASPRRPSRSSTSHHRELRASTPSQSKHGDTGLYQDVVARQSGGRSGREKFQPRSRSCDRAQTVNNNNTAGDPRRAKHAQGPYATWTSGTSRWSSTNSTVGDYGEPRRLAWKLQTPHGTLSLRSSRWNEISDCTIIGRSTSADRTGCRRQWLTIPRLSRRSMCDGRRAHSLPACLRQRRRSCGTTATDERISLEPIGRGIETLECEHCYLAATQHLQYSCTATTLPPLVIDSIKATDYLAGTSRRELVERLHNTTRRQCQECVHDYAAATSPQTPSKSLG